MTDRGTASVRTLLTRNRPFRSLWLSRLLSFAGDSAGLIALLLYTAERFSAASGTRPRPEQPRGGPDGTSGRAPLLAGALDGLRALWEDRALRILTAAFCAVVLFNGVDDVALVFLARHTPHAGNAAASLIYAGAGLGLLAGFLLLARLAPRFALPLLIVAGYAVSSVGNLLTGLAFAVVAALGFQVVRGLGIAAMDVGHTTLIQRVVPDAMLGRTFGNVYGAVGVAAGLSYVFGGLLLDATNPRVKLIVAGSGGLVAAALAAVALPRVLRGRLAPAQAAPG